MYREPEVLESKATEKTRDPTAPARSSIRRQRSVRYPSQNHPNRQPSHRPRPQRHDRPLMNALRVRERARAAERAFHIETAANQAHADASRQRRLESGRAILRDALSYEQPQQSLDMRSNDLYSPSAMRPPTPSTSSSRHLSRYSRLTPALREIGSGRPISRPRSRTPPPAYVPSPLYTSRDRSNRSSPNGLQSAHSDASGTARFAPAHASTRFEPVLDEAGYQHHESNRDGVTTDDSMLDDLPPLRRVNRRYIPLRPVQLPSSSRGVVDGLGDRWRSVSPDNDPWETLLSTMPPDERLPSTSTSSFRSNEDPAPYDSLSRNTAETMRDDDIDTYPVICDNTDSDSIDDDDDDDDEDNAAVEVLGLLEEGDLVTFGRHAREVADSVRRSGPVQQSLVPWLTRRQQASPASRRNDSLNDRAQTRLDEMLTLNGRTNDGRPSRERL